MDHRALQEWLDQRVADDQFSGSVLVWREGQPQFSYSGGYAHRGHGMRIMNRTRFAVASITKLVTAVTALRLVEDGRIGLSTPLVEVLPPEHQPAALTGAHTLHHLLSHTSGLANYHDDEAPGWGSFTSCWDRIPMYHVRRTADMLPLFADLPAVAEPGAEYRYCDANFVLAGLVVEALTGRPFADVAADLVLGPAGMTDSSFEALDLEPDRLATGYLTADGPSRTWVANTYSVPVQPMPDGGFITTGFDLAMLIDALTSGSLLRPETAAMMMSPQGPASDAVGQYGYGCHVEVDQGEVVIIGHGGSDPGVSALLSHWPADGTTVVVLCNFDRGSWAVTQRVTAELGLPDPRT